MKIVSLLEVVVVNIVLLVLLSWVTGNYADRIAYFQNESFSPSTVRYPLFLITSAVRGGTTIPGLLTIDWQQIIILILVVTDLIFIWTNAKGSKGVEVIPSPSAPSAPAQA